MAESYQVIIDVLKETHLATEEQIKTALEHTKRTGKSLLDTLVELEYVKDTDLGKILAYQFGMDFVEIFKLDIPKEVVDAVPESVAMRHNVFPIQKSKNLLKVAISNPLDIEVLDSLRFMLKQKIEPVLATKEDIAKALERYYGTMETEDTMDKLLQEVTEGALSVPEKDSREIKNLIVLHKSSP